MSDESYRFMVLWLIHKIRPIRRRYIRNWGPKWIQYKVDSFVHLLKASDRILDVGAGGGLISQDLRNRGFEVTPLDVDDLSYLPEIKPVVYDGSQMPFEDECFDVALLLTVLHHIKSPEQVLQETARVSKRIILIEDIYENPVQKYLTFFMDGIVNWGYSPMPMTNKNDAGWKTTFQEMGLSLESVDYIRVLGLFKQARYFLHKA